MTVPTRPDNANRPPQARVPSSRTLAGAADPAPLVVSLAHTAILLSASRSGVYALLDRGDLVAVKMGKRRLVTMASITALVDRLAGDPS